MPERAKPFAQARNRLDTVTQIFTGLQQMKNSGQEFYHKHFEYSLIISERDALYFEVNQWLLSVLPTDKNRALEVTSGRGSSNMVAPDIGEGEYKAKPLSIRFNESIERTMEIGGHKVRVVLRTPDVAEGSGRDYERPAKKLEFTTRSAAAQKAVIAQLEAINQNRATTRKAVLKMVGQWGDWTTRSDLPPRTMDSVSIPVAQKIRIFEDLKTFLEAEDQYNRLAIPWHRAYMFKGPPGTGKTSLVKALANEFNLDLWYVSLSDLSKESSLLQLLAHVGPRSLLLLEDIDTMKITQDRDGSKQGDISMSSLLNTLDGVATPHGLITMMTTNRFDVLDPALTRAGRMDVIEELGWPTRRTIADMYHHFFGKEWKIDPSKIIMDIPIKDLSTSQVAEVLKRHMTDPAGARKAIEDLLKGEK